jgi:hypothetical protein
LKAVEIASRCDVYTGGVVHAESIEGPQMMTHADEALASLARAQEDDLPPTLPAPDWRYRYNLKTGR